MNTPPSRWKRLDLKGTAIRSGPDSVWKVAQVVRDTANGIQGALWCLSAAMFNAPMYMLEIASSILAKTRGRELSKAGFV